MLRENNLTSSRRVKLLGALRGVFRHVVVVCLRAHFLIFFFFVKPVSKICSAPSFGLIHAEITLWYHSQVLFLFVLGVGQTFSSCFGPKASFICYFKCYMIRSDWLSSSNYMSPGFCPLGRRTGFGLSDPMYWSRGGFLVACLHEPHKRSRLSLGSF